MNKYLKAFTAFAVLTFAAVTWAAEQTVSLGYRDSSSTIEIDLRNYGYDIQYASVSLYCNGETVFTFDQGGVLYAAPGISWWQDSYGFMYVSGLEGEYVGGVSITTGGSFSTYNQTISWVSNYGPVWVVVDFLP